MPAPNRHPRGAVNKTLLIVLGIIAGLLVVCCGGGLYFAIPMYRDLFAAQQTAESFLADLGNGKLDAAYASTSQSYKQRADRKQFEAAVERVPALTAHSTRSYTGAFISQSSDRNSATIRAELSGGKAQPPVMVNVTVAKEGGQWKVSDFSGPAAATPPPTSTAPAKPR